MIKGTGRTKNGSEFDVSVETRRKRKIGQVVTGGEKDPGIWLSKGFIIQMKGPFLSKGSLVTDICRTAVTKALGSSPGVMPPATYSGLITLEWEGETPLDEAGVLQRIIRELLDLELWE